MDIGIYRNLRHRLVDDVVAKVRILLKCHSGCRIEETIVRHEDDEAA